MKKLRYFLVILSGLFVFASCQKEMSLETGVPFGALLAGSLKDSTGNCLPISVNGTYRANVNLTDSNYVLVQVNVTAPGNYRITSDSINGYFFKDSGFIATTGLKTFKLKGSGRPTLPVQSIFTVSFGSGFCSFSVDASGSSSGGGTGGGPNPNTSDSSWHFSEGTKRFNGFFDTIYTQNTSFGPILSLEGYTAATADTAMFIQVSLPSTTVQPGTYVTNATAAFGFARDTTNIFYEANPRVSGPIMQVVISSYDPATRILAGTFTGTARTQGGGTVNITNGIFRGRLNN